MQTNRRRSAAFLFSLAFLGPIATAAGAKILVMPVAEWTAKSAAADQALKAGRWDEGRAAAESLIDEILTRPAEGPGIADLLARGVAYRAIGLAGLGATEAAQWAAATARELGFRAGDLDLSSFGKAGELVRDALDPAPIEAEPARVEKGITRPDFLERTSPVYPPTLRKTHVGGTVRVDAVIGTDGKLTAPHVVQSPSVFLSLAALDSLQAWRFTPAQRDGKPIAVSYVVTMGFSLGRPQ